VDLRYKFINSLVSGIMQHSSYLSNQTYLQRKLDGASFDWPFFWACCLCVLPILIPTYPPMVDIPQHAAQIESIKNIWKNNWDYAHLFQITYLIPYWFGYLCCIILSLFFGPIWSVKFVIAIAAVSLPWFSWKFLEFYQQPKQLRWLLLILPFGFAYDWGFLNFFVSIPLGFFVLSKILSCNEMDSRKFYLKNILWMHLLFFAHILTAAVFCMIASFLMLNPWKGIKNLFCRMLPQISVLPILALYIYFNISSDNTDLPIYWDMGWHRILNLPGYFTGLGYFIPSLVVTLVFLASPFVLKCKLRKDFVYFLPFILYLLIMMISPNFIMGNAYNYNRFGFIGYPLYLLMFSSERIVTQEKNNYSIAAVFFVVSFFIIGFYSFRAFVFDEESEDYRRTIAVADPGKRMLIFVIDRYSAISGETPFYLHFPSWYQAETKGLVDFSFASMYQVIEYRSKKSHPVGPGFEWMPLSFDWDKHRGDNYDYFIFRSYRNPTSWIQERSRCNVELVSQNGTWWLFKHAPRPLDAMCPT